MLVSAFDQYHKAAQTHGHPAPTRAILDNPRNDGAGVKANLWPGKLLQFSGTIHIVDSEGQCTIAIAKLRRFQQVGFDTESVAYIPPHKGTNSQKAAIGQFCGDGNDCFIFRFHLWDYCYESFTSFMQDPSILKVALNVPHDNSHLQKRFPSIKLQGTVELATYMAPLQLGTKALDKMVLLALDLKLDKRIDHRFWETTMMFVRQRRYAANDAFAVVQLLAHAHAAGPNPDPICNTA